MNRVGQSKRLYHLGESKIHGHGLIATEHISANVDIGLSHIGIGLINGKVIAGEATDIGNFQNHNDSPNCINKIVGKDLHMFTIDAVDCGDELTINFYENANICVNIENSETWQKTNLL
tara:strand:- start:91 stop:447 length:357 start_codon:yes stop_codon:yes gene_type:complete